MRPAEEELASRIVEFAQCQGALRACHAGSTYEELSGKAFPEPGEIGMAFGGAYWAICSPAWDNSCWCFSMILLGKLPVCHQHRFAV